MDENLELRFGATATGVDAVTSRIIEQLHQINASSQQMGGGVAQTNTLLAQTQTHLQAANTHTRNLGDSAHHARGGFMEMLEEVEGIHRKFGMVAEAFAAAFAVEAISSSIERVLAWGEAHAAAAEHIEQEAQRLGMSTTAIQEWNTVATLTGHTGDEFVQAFTRLERSFSRTTRATSEQAGAFRQLGIDATAAHDPQELLLQIADRFHTMADGPQKVAIAMALMGRSGAQNIPILNEGRVALEEMMNTGRQYGAVMDENMIARNAQIAETLNTSKLAMEGVGNTLFTALGPAVQDVAKGFNQMALDIVQSYRAGGNAKTAFDALGSTLRGLVTFVATFASVILAFFLYMGSGVEAFVAVVQTGWEYVKSQCRQLEIQFETLGQVIYASLTNNIMAAAQSMSEGLANMNAEVANSAHLMAGLANNPWMASANRLSSTGDSIMAGAGRFIQRMVGPGKTGTATGHYGPERGTSMAVHDLHSGGGGHHGGESQVGQWEQELHQMETASGEYFRDQTQRELAFWQSKLALTQEGSRTWYSVQDKIFTLSRHAAQEHYQGQIADLGAELDAAQGNYAHMAEIEQRKVELVRATYGEESRQLQEVLREQARMQRQHEDELRAQTMSSMQQRSDITRQAMQTDLQIQSAGFDMQRSMVEYAVRGGEISQVEAARRRAALDQQEYAARVAAANREYQVTAELYRAELLIRGLTDQQKSQLNAELERATADHLNRMRQLETDNNAKIQQDALATASAYRDTWTSRLQPVESALTQMVNGFLTSAQTLRGAILSFGSSILQAVNSWIMRWVTMHIAGEHAKTAATIAGNVARTASEATANATGMAMTAHSATAEITTHAAVAAAGALRAISHIPVIGPFIAPAIAAGILALAMGFISRVASAREGWGQVPADGMMTELHKDEMVLPAYIASPMRSALSGGWGLGPTGLAAGSALESRGGLTGSDGGTGAGRRPVNLYLSAMDGRSARRFLLDNKHDLADALVAAARDANV